MARFKSVHSIRKTLRALAIIALVQVLPACEQKEDEHIPSEIEEAYSTDTLPHGVKEVLNGTVIADVQYSSFDLSTKKLSLSSQKQAYPLPDSLGRMEPLYVIPGTDTFEIGEELDYEQWEVPLVFPLFYDAGKPNRRDNASVDIHYFSTKSGLPSNQIMDVYCDRSGNMWISVQDKGVVRYDGCSFFHFSESHGLVGNRIYDIFQDKEGNMWFCTADGVSKLDGQKFTNFQVITEDDFYFTCTMEADDNEIWFGTYNMGIIHFNDGVMTKYSKEQGLGANQVYSIQVDPNGKPWFGLRKNGMASFDGEGFIIYPQGDIMRKSVRTIQFEDDGTTWIGTEYGVMLFKDDIFYSYEDKEIIGNDFIWDMFLDKKGVLWTGTYKKGVSSFDGTIAKQYNMEVGLSDPTVRSITEDIHGSIWTSTDDGGVNIINERGFNYLLEIPGIKSLNAKDIVVRDSSVWVAAFGAGLLRFNGEDVELFDFMSDIQFQQLYTDSKDRLWVAGLYDIGIYDGEEYNRIYTYENELSANIRCFEEAEDGTMWMGRVRGLMTYKDSTITEYYSKSGFTDDKVTSLLASGSNMWIGTYGSGLYQYDGEFFTRYSIPEGLTNLNVTDLYENQDGIWVATDGGGIFLYNNNEFTNYSLDDGLSEVYIRSFEEDAEGRLWASMDNGVAYYDGQQFVAFSENTGLNMGGFHVGSSTMDQDGTLWWGSANGIMKLKPEIAVQDTMIPELQVNDVLLEQHEVDFRTLLQTDNYMIKGTDIDLSEVQLDSVSPYVNTPHGLILPHHIDQLTFQFSASDINGAQQFKYSYWLEGADDGWSPLTNETVATYNHLKHGEYTFKVKAKNQFGIWSEEFHMPFVIRTPWWQAYWAYILYVIFAFGSIFLYMRWRTSSLRKRQEELRSTVDERTAELKLEKEQVVKKNNEIRDSIQYAKRIQSAILPSNSMIAQHLPESFVLYKPKDIVAGDFYWMQALENKVLFAAADCTGHGVPGAMVSVVCNNGLNRSVREYRLTNPAGILDKTREIVITEFDRSGDGDKVKDGMDIAICSLENKLLKYAGAHNPLWIIRQGAQEVEEIKADKQPIGRYAEHKPFTSHEIELFEGDTVYIFSDGFADQFGGEKGKKFKAKNFKKLLLSIQGESMERQKELIDLAFENWRGSLEQLDDVCVIGVRI